MRARRPLRELLLVTLPASWKHRGHVIGAEMRLLRHIALDMRSDAPQVRLQGAGMALDAVDFLVRGVSPHVVVDRNLVTARATGAPRALVIQVGRRNAEQRNRNHRDGRHPSFEARSHDRKPFPFHVFTMCSETRYALAIMVNTGLKPPFVTCTLPSATNTLSTSCAWQFRFTTLVFGSLPIRHVPAWCWPPLVPWPGSFLQVSTAPASRSHISAFRDISRPISSVCGCLSPEMRRTGMPQRSFTFASSCTRESQIGISCVGPCTATV